MFLQWIWFFMIGASILYASLTGRGSGLLSAALSGTADAVGLSLRLCAGYLFFCGMLEIAKALNIHQKMSRCLKPLLHGIMPRLHSEEARSAVILNLTANLLGLGNAATPMGIEAVRLMQAEALGHPKARHSIYMLLIINATGVQLLPTTILSLRVAAGSSVPNAILLPSIACTCLSTAVGVALGLVGMKLTEARHEL